VIQNRSVVVWYTGTLAPSGKREPPSGLLGFKVPKPVCTVYTARTCSEKKKCTQHAPVAHATPRRTRAYSPLIGRVERGYSRRRPRAPGVRAAAGGLHTMPHAGSPSAASTKTPYTATSSSSRTRVPSNAENALKSIHHVHALRSPALCQRNLHHPSIAEPAIQR